MSTYVDKKGNEWTCVKGPGGGIGYTMNGKATTKKPDADGIAALSQCSPQRHIQAGKGAVLPTSPKLSPRSESKGYACVKTGKGTSYYKIGSPNPIPASSIDAEVRKLITCQAAAQAFHDPHTIGKTRSKTRALPSF